MLMVCPRCWGAKQEDRGVPCGCCGGSGARPDEFLSQHFRLSELLRSSNAVRYGVANEPTPDEHAHLKQLAQELLEPLRLALGPLHVDSGLRTPGVNRLARGSRTSAHLGGFAADLVPLNVTRRDVVDWLIKSPLKYDQVILEGSWVHVSLFDLDRRQRREARFAVPVVDADGRVTFTYPFYDPHDARVC